MKRDIERDADTIHAESPTPVQSLAELRTQHVAATTQLAVLKRATPRSADDIANQKQIIQRLAEAISQREAAGEIT